MMYAARGTFLLLTAWNEVGTRESFLLPERNALFLNFGARVSRAPFSFPEGDGHKDVKKAAKTPCTRSVVCNGLSERFADLMIRLRVVIPCVVSVKCALPGDTPVCAMRKNGFYDKCYHKMTATYQL